jgi:uncharacterized protein (DUF697 family)
MSIRDITQPNNKVPSAAIITGPAGAGAILSEKEALASLRVLVCIAGANGSIAPEERAALEGAVSQLQLPSGATIKGLLDEQIDLDAEMAVFTSPESRDLLYQSALGFARMERSPAPEAQGVLERIRTALHIGDETASLTRRIVDEARDTVLPSNIQASKDPALRTAEVKSDIAKYAVLTGVLGSFPVPGMALATDLGVVAVQVKMVRDIGQRWGHKVDKEAAVSLMGGLGIGTGARIAVTNLAKVVPVWGSAVGATGAFASTWALGKVAEKYFESGMQTDAAVLKSEFQTAQTEGRQEYVVQQEEIGARTEEHGAALTSLNAELMAGKVSQREFSGRIAKLA